MKKNNLIKVIGAIFLVYVLLTWIIPTGYYSNGAYVESDVVPVGLFDIIRYPIITMCSTAFIINGIVILLIGALYGVLNKTGAYQNLIDKIVEKYKKKGNLFLIITSVIFIILSSLTALDLPLFAMVPFFAAILLLLGYNKVTTMFATIGGILVGNVVSIYGYNIAGIASYITNDVNYKILYRLLLLVFVTVSFVFANIKLNNKKDKSKKESIPFYEKVTSKKSGKNILVISIIFMIITLIGMANIEKVFNITLFSDIHSKINSFEINGYPLFKNLIGSIYTYGSWSNYELAMMLVILIFVIKIMYKIKFNDLVDGIKNGVITMLPLAFYALIVNTILLMLNAIASGYTIFPTIADKILSLTKGFNILTYSFTISIGSILFNDFPYLLNSLYSPITTIYSNSANIIAITTQVIHGIIQILVPTSVMLVLGLKYFDISYSNWLKSIYKFILIILEISILVIALIALI